MTWAARNVQREVTIRGVRWEIARHPRATLVPLYDSFLGYRSPAFPSGKVSIFRAANEEN